MFNNNPLKERLAKIFSDVCKDIDQGYYTDRDGDVVKFSGVKTLKYGTKMFYEDELGSPVIIGSPVSSTIIRVEIGDSFEVAKRMIQSGGSNVAVLNMASAKNPGGGVINGSRAQEEELCRRSNLILSLYGVYSKGMFNFNLPDYDYPIPTYATIYTPNVTVYREPVTYDKVKEPYKVNIISAAMIIQPDLDENGDIEKKYVHIVKKKIRCVLRTALLTKNDRLVLGAWGCGAFGCPSKHMARLFKKVLEEPEFSGAFSEIVFAILEDQNSVRSNNKEGNYKPFKEVFG